jgi:pimeloyl-ACP methyl ester carboxylesterase
VTRRALAFALAVVLGVLGLAVGSAVGAPTGVDDPGRVLELTPRGGGAFDLRYRSTGIDGHATSETAVVWLPAGPRSGDVVAWGHPTTGLSDRCAPSTGPDVVPGLDQLLAAGHVVVAPDYEGLGSAGDHPYLIGTSEARSVLDAIRAARSVADVDGRSVVFGWSQGGHAALFAARLARSYAPDVRLAGVAAIAPVTDMPGLVDGTSTFSQIPGFVALVTAGYASTYDDLDPTAVVPDAADALPVVRHDCAIEAGSKLAGTITTAPGRAWIRRLRQNDPTTKRLRIPALLVHGQQDALLPFGATADAYDRLCANGSPVRLDALASAGHGDVVARSTDDVVRWLEGRLAGNRLTGCDLRWSS